MPGRNITLPGREEILRKLLEVDPELERFAPYLAPWARKIVREPERMVIIITMAIEQFMEETGSTPDRKGMLVHYAPEIAEALAGRNGFSEEVRTILKDELRRASKR